MYVASLYTPCLWCSVCFCTGHFVMVPKNLTCPHCLQHFFFEHLFHLYFKNRLDGNYKAQSFHIWYITSSRGPLPKLLKLCPWGQNWPRPGGHNFTLNYIRKTSNDFLSRTANGNLTKLYRNSHWVVIYQNCLISSDWLHK